MGAAFGQLFTMPWFNFALGLLLIGLALSMFDLYQIRLPGFISNALGARSGAVGALIMGLLIELLPRLAPVRSFSRFLRRRQNSRAFLWG